MKQLCVEKMELSSKVNLGFVKLFFIFCYLQVAEKEKAIVSLQHDVNKLTRTNEVRYNKYTHVTR